MAVKAKKTKLIADEMAKFSKGEIEFLFDTMIKLRKLNMRVCWQYIIFSFNEHQLEEAHKIAKKHNLNMQVKKSSRFSGGEIARPKQRNNYVRKENNIKE